MSEYLKVNTRRDQQQEDVISECCQGLVYVLNRTGHTYVHIMLSRLGLVKYHKSGNVRE